MKLKEKNKEFFKKVFSKKQLKMMKNVKFVIVMNIIKRIL